MSEKTSERERDGEMTIDELARKAGMTVRNVRAHQSRGLLPAPEIRARTGYYGDEHLQRLQLIRELQAGGLSLKAVERVLDGTFGDASGKALDFTRALASAFEEEEPEIVGIDELTKEWGEDPRLLKQAEDLGLLRRVGKDTWEVRSPRLRRASLALSELGVSRKRGIEIVSKLRKNSESVARAYVELFLKEIWRPFQESGEPAEGWAEVTEALERLRPLASESLVAVFQVVMAEAVEEAMGRELKRMAKTGEGSRSGK
jgi:DNA-binding transcriptional MerR regulator